jgi:predicted dinucleotide-utilizing enzyme
MDKIDDALQARLEASAADTVPVIVTLTGAIDEDALTACGLDIAHRFEEISAVSGAIAASDVPRLAALPGVKAVELDSEMRAMNR